MPSKNAVLEALSNGGLLLKQDKMLPSVVGILTGESLCTSWWSHPRAHLIYSVLSGLGDHPDILCTKLLYRKDTFVHRSLWPASIAVATARESWQLDGLSGDARRLLERLDRGEGPLQAVGAAVKELEFRLLAPVHEIHTETGRHAMVLESWTTWSERVGSGVLESVARACSVLEQAAVTLGASRGALPWPARA
jgi:hypothetical protein